MRKTALDDPGRRRFLFTAPAVAATGLVLGDLSILRSDAETQEAYPGTSNFQIFTSRQIQADLEELAEKAGNISLVEGRNFTAVLTREAAKSAVEFEWHASRDHIVQILEGTTVYELGGMPRNARETKPGEWLAPASEDAKKITLNKGDMVVIPRGTPHRRCTEGVVAFLLISPQERASA